MLIRYAKKYLSLLITGVTLAVMSSVLSSCTQQEDSKSETVVRTIFSMDTEIAVNIVGVDATAAYDELEAVLKEFEAAASMHLPDSEVAQINSNAGEIPTEISEDVYYNIARAIQASEQTGGLFDITIGAITDLWGVSSDNPSVPPQSQIDEKLKLVDYTEIELSAQNGIYTAMLKEKGQKIDLGGIAKGYAIDLMKDVFDKFDIEQALISVGGNVMAYKDKAGKPFVVGLRHPVKEHMSTYVCHIQLSDAIISTTGGYERFFEENGVTYHHVMDPRTGYPANSGLLSVSIIDTNGLRADYMSTAMFVGGLDYSLALMQSGRVKAIVIDENNNVYITASLRDNIDETKNDIARYTFSYV